LLDRWSPKNRKRGEGGGRARGFFAYAQQLGKDNKWSEAAAAYSKAHGLDPKGDNATDALAAHHYTLGKALEAQGKDGGPDFRKAVALKPDYAPAQDAAESSGGGSPRPSWMLYAAMVSAALAAALFGVGLMRRRRV